MLVTWKRQWRKESSWGLWASKELEQEHPDLTSPRSLVPRRQPGGSGEYNAVADTLESSTTPLGFQVRQVGFSEGVLLRSSSGHCLVGDKLRSLVHGEERGNIVSSPSMHSPPLRTGHHHSHGAGFQPLGQALAPSWSASSHQGICV